MGRFWFLTFAALVAAGVGGAALLAPDMLLQSKGIGSNPVARVWVREVGALLLAVGVVAWLVRAHVDSPTLRAVLWGNAVLQLGLLPIEPIAYVQSVIPDIAGIVPNTVLHAVLAVGFIAYARAMQPPGLNV